MGKALDEILSETPRWRDRLNREPVPHESWGRDHWALLLQVENRAVDFHGQLDWNQLTLSRRNWPMLWAARNPWETSPAEDAADQFGLRLKPRRHPDIPEIKKGHCEADALMDLVDHGLVTIEMPPVSPTGLSYLRPDGNALNSPSPREPVTGWTEWALMPWARFSLTDWGWSVAAGLRKHRGNRGKYADFSMPEKLLEVAGS